MKHPGTSGGYSAKKGNQYELIWAVEYALKCIQDERCSITYEELDPDLAEGSEFTYVDEHDSTHVFQVKRQKDTSDKWTIDTLEAYSVAGGMGFGWWLVEHYLSYHADCPDGCGLGCDRR